MKRFEPRLFWEPVDFQPDPERVALWKEEKEADPDEEDSPCDSKIEAEHLRQCEACLMEYAVYLSAPEKDPDEAEAAFHQMLELDPNYAPALGNYALFLYRVRKKPRRANRFFRFALAAEPWNTEVLLHYAQFLDQTGAPDKKVGRIFRTALKMSPEDPELLTDYADFLWRCGEMKRAGTFFKRSAQAGPDDPYTLGCYASFLWRGLGRKKRAQSVFHQLVELPGDCFCSPSQQAYWMAEYAGFLLKARRKRKAAATILLVASELDPDNGRIRRKLEKLRHD